MIKKSSPSLRECIMIMVFANVFLYQIIAHEPTTEKQHPVAECKRKNNKELKCCFKSLSHTQQKKIFTKLSLEQKKELLLLLSLHDYEELIDALNEYDWNAIVNQLPDEEKNYWPSTLYEQRIALHKLSDLNDSGNPHSVKISWFFDALPFFKKIRISLKKIVNNSSDREEQVEKEFKKYLRQQFNL